MKRFVLFALLSLVTASCTMSVLREHTAATPPEEGCGHCHYVIYKEWKITYKPYEQVPVPGSTIAPGPFPQYHDRKGREGDEGKAIMPERKDCSGCHAGARKPEGACSREKAGFK